LLSPCGVIFVRLRVPGCLAFLELFPEVFEELNIGYKFTVLNPTTDPYELLLEPV